jgi:hypothetical protein
MTKTFRLLAAICGALVLPMPPALLAAANPAAANQAAGTISGRVQNIATGRYLNNARVTLKGSNQTVFTDRDGTYRFANVPAGPAALEVFYTDLDPQTVAVTVSAGGSVEQNIDLTSVKR